MKLYYNLIEVLCRKSKEFAKFYTQFETLVPAKIIEHAGANNEYYYKSNNLEFRSQYGEDKCFCMMATDRSRDAVYMLEINADYVDPYNIIEKDYGRDIAGFVKNEEGVQTIYKIRKTYISRDDKTMDRVALVATKEVLDYANHVKAPKNLGELTHLDVARAKIGLI